MVGFVSVYLLDEALCIYRVYENDTIFYPHWKISHIFSPIFRFIVEGENDTS